MSSDAIQGRDGAPSCRMDAEETPPGYKRTEVGVIPDSWSVEPLLKALLLPTGQVDPRREPYCSMILVAPDHVESATGRLLVKETAQAQGAISGKYPFSAGDIVYSKIRPYLRKAILADFDGLCSADMYPLSPAADVSPGFMLAVLLGHRFSGFAESVSARSGIPKINRNELSEYRVALPPPAEQRAIAEALSDADGLLGALEALIAKKRAIKQAAMQQLLTGKTRLPGFSGEWEAKPFVAVLDRLNAKGCQIQTSEYQTVGQYRVIDQGKDLVVGFSDQVAKRFKSPTGGLIVFGDHTCIAKFIDFDFVIGADGTQLIRAKPGHCTRFFAYQLQHKGIEPTGYNRHFKFLKEREFLVPPSEEQSAIATVLSDMDGEIAALEARRGKTRAIKQGMMQQLLTGRVRLETGVPSREARATDD